MNFAWLGDAPETLPLGRAIARSREHTLVCAAIAPNVHAELARNARGLRLCGSWQELLADESIDAVIVSGDDDDVLQGARQLAAAGRMLVVFPTLGQSETFLHELALLESEGTARLYPACPWRFHPYMQRAGELGRIRHVKLDRHFAASAGNGLLQRHDLDAAFLVDADLLRHLCGEYNQVTALRVGTAEEGYSAATVTLAGKAAATATWSCAANAAPGRAPWTLCVTGESGQAVLSGDAARGEFTLHIEGTAASPLPETLTADTGAELLESIVATSKGDDHAASSPATSISATAAANWTDLTRDLELLYAVEQSLRRRRTIDVYYEAPSERSTFKTKMTAAGCSLLMFTLLAVVLYLVVANAVPLNDTLKKLLVGLIFLPIGLFLALQLLYFVAKPAQK
jgi:predicted dehydrogenase